MCTLGAQAAQVWLFHKKWFASAILQECRPWVGGDLAPAAVAAQHSVTRGFRSEWRLPQGSVSRALRVDGHGGD